VQDVYAGSLSAHRAKAAIFEHSLH
jgi:hypothetical protein